MIPSEILTKFGESLEDLVFGRGISVIEWSGRIPAFVPPQAIKVNIEIKAGLPKDGDTRFIHIYREGEN